MYMCKEKNTDDGVMIIIIWTRIWLWRQIISKVKNFIYESKNEGNKRSDVKEF